MVEAPVGPCLAAAASTLEAIGALEKRFAGEEARSTQQLGTLLGSSAFEWNGARTAVRLSSAEQESRPI